MSQAVDKAAVLEEAQRLFYHHGSSTLSRPQLLAALQLTAAEFRGLFASKDDLFAQALQHDLDRQKQEQAELFARADTPVERMLALLWHGLGEVRKGADVDYGEIQRTLPRTWDVLMRHLTTHSYPQIYQLLEEGIEQGQFLPDLDRELIVKISLEMFSIVLNSNVFPPVHYNLADVFRNIFLYYIRGVCTAEGMRLVAHHFARI